MSYYADDKSDLKRRGMPTVQPTSGKLRRSSRKTKDSDRQSESGNKETEETNS